MQFQKKKIFNSGHFLCKQPFKRHFWRVNSLKMCFNRKMNFYSKFSFIQNSDMKQHFWEVKSTKNDFGPRWNFSKLNFLSIQCTYGIESELEGYFSLNEARCRFYIWMKGFRFMRKFIQSQNQCRLYFSWPFLVPFLTWI